MSKVVDVGDPSVRLVHGEALDVLQGLDTHSVDVLITDPPYSSGGQFRGDRIKSTRVKYLNSGSTSEHADFTGDTRDQHAYRYWCALWLTECARVVKPAGVACLFTDWRQLPTTTDALQSGGWLWLGIVPWNKTGACRPRQGFRNQCEYIVWGSNGPMGQPHDDSVYLPGFFTQALRSDERHHIAGKPVRILREMCKLAPAGGTVLDPFAGSGSTLLAASQEGRRSVGIEMLEVNVEITRRRFVDDAPLFADLITAAQGGAHGGQEEEDSSA